MTTDLTIGPAMIAVRDIEDSRRYYEDVLGGTSGEVHVVEHGNFLRCFVDLGGRSVQLMQPLEGERVLNRFLEKNGEGLYGQIYLTSDLGAIRVHMEAQDVRVVGDIIDLGDMYELVLHPASTHGVLTVFRQLTTTTDEG